MSPGSHLIPLYTSTKTGPWYVTIASVTDTQKQDAYEMQFAENTEKKTIQVTKQINSQRNLSVQTVLKNTWQSQ